MSIPLSLRNCPSHVMESAFIIKDSQRSPRSADNGLVSLSFPKSKIALWDPTPVGTAVNLHLAHYRNPKLLVVEKAVRLAHRHARQSNHKLFPCFLLGSVVVDCDEEGITVRIDRFDPGREASGCVGKVPTALLPGDFLIPCVVDIQRSACHETIAHTAEDFSLAFKMMQSYCCSKEAVDPARLLLMRAHITCTENVDKLNFDFHWAAITVATALTAIPLKQIPIIPTALARNLSSSLSITHVQGACKFGYLTMDQTRKLLLVLESDPKVFTLPVVGIWLSGVTHIHSPQVWTSCLRYLFSSSIQERVLSERGSFLIVLYSLTHKEPEFYECCPCSGDQQMNFQLLTSTETLSLFKNVEPSDSHPLKFHLCVQDGNPEAHLFKEVVTSLSATSNQLKISPQKSSVGDHDSGVEDEDFSPRPSPSPHPLNQQISRIRPSVPELSLVFDGSFVDPKNESKYLPVGNCVTPDQQSTKHYRHSGTTCSKELSCDKEQHSCGTRESFCLRHHLGNQSTPLNPDRNLQSQTQLGNQKDGPQVRKGSISSSTAASSTSSSSTPKSGTSPNTSVHHPKMLAEKKDSRSSSTMDRKGCIIATGTGPSPVHLQKPLSPSKINRQVQKQNNRLMAQAPRCIPDLQIAVPHIPPHYPPNFCSCFPHHGYVPYCQTNVWQGMTNVGFNNSPQCCSTEVCSQVSYENTCTSFPPSEGNLLNASYSPICNTNNPRGQGFNEKVENSNSTNEVMSPIGGQFPSPLSPQSCERRSPCTYTPPPRIGIDSGTMGLPADAYKILVEQDKQLKMLQAQIQRLLEAQALASCSTKDSCSHVIPPQSEKQVEFVATETQTAAGVQMRKSVSIAVSTGASLFWGPANECEDDCVSQHKENGDSHTCGTISVSINTEEKSQTTTASSLKAVDLPDFVESNFDTRENSIQALTMQINDQASHSTVQSPVLGESISMSLKFPPEEGDSHLHETKEGKAEQVVSTQEVLKNDQKFYHDLLGQVNQLLESCPAEDDALPDVKGVNTTNVSSASFIDSDKCENSRNSLNQTNKNSVRNATVRQLESLGVKVKLDSSDKIRKDKGKVDSASTLACINPEALIPRLNYVSFTNADISGFGSSGVDLSMEANAIALKYLTESQLSQLSHSRSGKTGPFNPSVIQSLLQNNSDKSIVGFSLISPNNMSIATRKYMKKYGLIECSDGSEDEESSIASASSGNDNVVKNNTSALDFSFTKQHIQRDSKKRSQSNHQHNDQPLHPATSPNSEGNVLRNITNGNTPPRFQTHLQPMVEESTKTLKGVKRKTKLLSGPVQVTKHPDQENGPNNVWVFPERQKATSGKQKDMERADSVGNVLDVNRLRQLPKLF